jgi:hypothetical protein
MFLSGISFTNLLNTKTISSATLTLHYLDELSGTPGTTLVVAVGAADGTLTISAPGNAVVGSILQIESELFQVTSIASGGAQYTVTRGVQGSTAAAHAAQLPVYLLLDKTVLVTLPDGFFGSPYSGTWSYPIPLPDVRVASAELFVTNDLGNSPTAAVSFTQTVSSGLRSLSGGQYSIQVEGYLAVDRSVAPAVVVETTRSVRDVSAVLAGAADQDVQLQLNLNGSAYCSLTIPANKTYSNNVDGAALPPLPTEGQITLSILQVGSTYPGSDLTVSIRL